MTRTELTQRLISHCPFLDNTQAKKIVTLFHQEITAAVVRGEKVLLHEFGTFILKERPARLGHNPRTKQKVAVPVRKFMAFKPSKILLEDLKVGELG